MNKYLCQEWIIIQIVIDPSTSSDDVPSAVNSSRRPLRWIIISPLSNRILHRKESAPGKVTANIFSSGSPTRSTNFSKFDLTRVLSRL